MAQIIFANLPDGLQPLSLFDEAIAAIQSPEAYIVESGNYTADGSELRIFVNKTIGSPTAILMDSAESMGNLEIVIKDMKGDAFTNNITVTDSSGATFDGQSSLTITSDFGSYRIKAVSDNWYTI